MLRINRIHNILIVGKDSSAIRANACEIGTRPVKDRHKIIAHYVNVCLSENFERFDIIFDVFVTAAGADLDVIRDVDRLNAHDRKALFFHNALERIDFVCCPQFSGLFAHQCRYHALDARHLTDFIERYGVITGTVPS